FSALENIVLPQMIAGVARRNARVRGKELLNLVGLAKRVDHRPAQLSGGEEQRVAIARALANAPALLLADEPTGNLDHRTSDEVFGLLTKLVKAVGMAAMVATHNLELAGRMDRVLTITDGYLTGASEACAFLVDYSGGAWNARLMAPADFVHLRVHSAYSLSEGAIKIKQLIELCRRQKMPAVAVTDSGNLFGAFQFTQAAAEAGIQPIIGCQLGLRRENG